MGRVVSMKAVNSSSMALVVAVGHQRVGTAYGVVLPFK